MLLFDTVIVGAGIIGMMSAHLLSIQGHSVCLIERGVAGAESSWAGGGILSPLYAWRYPDAVTDLACWSQLHYSDYLTSLSSRTGIDAQWRQSGLLIHQIKNEAAEIQTWLDKYPQHAQFLSNNQTRQIEPNSNIFQSESLWFPDIAQVRNPRFIKMLRKVVDLQAITIREESELTEIVMQNQQFQAVKMGSETITANNLIVTAGAWSATILASITHSDAGEKIHYQAKPLDIYPVRGQMMIFRTPRNTITRMILSDGHYLIPRDDGRVLIGSTLEHVGFNKATTKQAYHELYESAINLAPILAEFPVEFHWSGLRPGSNEGIPIIGAHPDIRGLYINSGHYRNGIVLAYASARLITDIVNNNPTILDKTAYQVKT